MRWTADCNEDSSKPNEGVFEMVYQIGTFLARLTCIMSKNNELQNYIYNIIQIMLKE